VVDVRSALVNETLILHMADGNRLVVTASHPVRVDGEWTKVATLRRGQQVETEGGSSRIVQISRHGGPTRVFDLTVAPNPNFFASGVLVHNKSVPARPTVEGTVGSWVGTIDNQLYLLDLNADGTGRAARLWGQTQVYDIDSWRLGGYGIRIELSAPPDGRRFLLQGKARGNRFGLRLGWWGDSRSKIGWFSRPPDLSRDIEILRAALNNRDG